MSSIPTWLQILLAAGGLLTACFGSYIAYRQSRIARSKLNGELYEKRLEVYNAVQGLIFFALYSDHISSTEHYAEFHEDYGSKISSGKWLLSKDLSDFLEGLSDKVLELHIYTGILKKHDDGIEPMRHAEELRRDVNKLRDVFSSASERVDKLFRPLLTV